MIEVAVSSAQHEVVLEDEGGDPEVMDGDRFSLAAQVAEERGVVVGGLLVREKRGHAWLGEEFAEHALVFRATPSQGESSAKLRDDDEGEEDRFGVADQLDNPRLAAAQPLAAVDEAAPARPVVDGLRDAGRRHRP